MATSEYLATLRLTPPEITFQQSQQVAARFENHSARTLPAVNLGNRSAMPWVLLRDLGTGEVTRHALAQSSGAPADPAEVPPGASLDHEFTLDAVLTYPGPGRYEVGVRYEWDWGESQCASEWTPVEIAPADMTSPYVVPARGGWSTLETAAWVNRVPGAGIWKIGLTTIELQRRPRVSGSFEIGYVTYAVEPIMSAPPNTTSALRCVAWTEQDRLRWVLVKRDEVTPVLGSEFGLGGSVIVPPVLVDEKEATALLLRTSSRGGSQLIVARLDETGAYPKPLLECAQLEPRFARNVYLANGSRYTFLISPSRVSPGREGCSLRSVQWADASLVEHSTWNCEFRAGDLLLTRANQVRGALLCEQRGGDRPGLAMITWQFTEAGGYSATDPIEVRWTKAASPERAIVGVNEIGAAFALLQEAGSGDWHWWSQRSDTSPLRAAIFVPIRIAFAGGVDPIILHTPPGRGFQFCSV